LAWSRQSRAFTSFASSTAAHKDAATPKAISDNEIKAAYVLFYRRGKLERIGQALQPVVKFHKPAVIGRLTSGDPSSIICKSLRNRCRPIKPLKGLYDFGYVNGSALIEAYLDEKFWSAARPKSSLSGHLPTRSVKGPRKEGRRHLSSRPTVKLGSTL
jgi:hypothetical protein